VPIFRGDGSFFGTLCAIDPEPARLDPETIATLQMYAEMIGMQLDHEHAVPSS
jgi:GAF domain-containing protein